MARRCVVLHARFDAEAVLESIARDRVTLLSVVPTMLSALLDADRGNVLPRLRAILVGGAACPAPLAEECARRGIRVLMTYGLTEACSQVTVQRLRLPPVVERGSGYPLPGTEVVIRDPDGNALPVGAVGCIHIRGPTLMRGYRGHPPISGWFDTGDMGALDDEGRLHVAARRSDLIVTGGENVYPVEIEQALLKIPGVREAIVFGTPDERWGQIVSAAIVLGEAVDENQVHSEMAARVASFKRPRLVCFVEAIPSTSAGKPDRMAARERFRGALKAC